MQFASIRDFRLNAAAILGRMGGKENVIVTRRGKPVALLVPATEGMLEDLLRAVQGARLRAAVEEARREARQAGADRMSMAEINAEIRRVRRSRRA